MKDIKGVKSTEWKIDKLSSRVILKMFSRTLKILSNGYCEQSLKKSIRCRQFTRNEVYDRLF